MKSQISSVDLHYLIEEMQFLIDARVDKIYHPKKEELLLQFHVTSKGKQILRIISGKFIFLSEHKEKYDAPGGFCMFLRKNLDNSRLREISQVGSERIVKIVFDTKKGLLSLYVELFGKGNIVLCDDKDAIINALTQQKWADRVIMKGEEYKFPKREWGFGIKKKDFLSLLDSDKELVMKLAKDVGLGGTYAEEICLESEIDKKKKKLNDEDKEKVYKNFKKVISGTIKPYIVYKNGKIKDIIPLNLKFYEGAEIKEKESFNSAFDEFFIEEMASKEEFISKHQAQIDKVKKIVEQQSKQIASLENKADENSRKGEMIYEKYQEIEEILKEINKAREKYSFDEINEKLKGHKVVKSVDGKGKKIVIEI